MRLSPLAHLPLLIAAAGLAAALPVAATPPVNPEPPLAVPDSPAVPLEEIRRFVEVFRTIQQGYVDPIDDARLMRSAIRALLADLDPHSAYLPATSAGALREEIEGVYDGIGVEVDVRPDRSLRVVGAIEGGPAQQAGLRTGDVIVAIDGRPVGSRRDEAPAQALRGTAGTSVRLSVLRPGEAQPRDYTLVRRRIAAGSVDARLLEPGYGYLRIRYFEGDTADETRRAVERLARESGGPLAGLVLDLRNNPGGLLTTAVATADLFLEEGPIVSTRGRTPVANTLYRATPGDLLGGAPMAVLLDVGTASSAEVVAGALRDQRRALLLGARSFGKGSVQTVVDLGNGDAVKLTTARYYTPAGRSIQAVGIAPDVRLPGTPVRGLREQDLPSHLQGEGEVADGYATGTIIEGESAVAEALRRVKQAAASRQATARRPGGAG
ncbi:S41 family peptidase [Silanimonas lenta]|uniref:S41 family peptidase n=1 Tax=Silanimonas lenta TaxID=265429 RepID=UPI0004167E54|nr:S41 family peptidase [Silanimonas lenta]